ncbi:2'-5' RNA ligase family protein [Gryllotalpicola koreensis]|uniref:2'-5' RNA ligase family protein n=1 Tax=Gryllotalpicola koreensis TaxID=993086 RepID=A0ABP7ZYK4_9MICO
MRFFVVVLPLAPLSVGAGFRRDSWPAHVTLIPPFQTDAPAEPVLEAIRAAASGHAPLVARGESHARFGRRRDVPVTTIELTPEFEALHVDVLAAVDRFLGRGVHLSHVGPRDYRPHVTVQQGGALEPGESVTLPQLAVVDMRPHGDARHRAVVATVPL